MDGAQPSEQRGDGRGVAEQLAPGVDGAVHGWPCAREPGQASGIAHQELLKNHLFPTLGAKRLDEITDEDVQQLEYKAAAPQASHGEQRAHRPERDAQEGGRVARARSSELSRPHFTGRCHGVLKWRRANARPEPDFKYSSNAFAAAGDANVAATTSDHGQPEAVCRLSPRL